MKGVNGKEPGFDVMREQRLQIILQMRVSGASLRAISKHLHRLADVGQIDPKTGAVVWQAPQEWKIDHVQVGNELKEALRNARKENKRTAEELGLLAEARLDSLLLGVWPKAQTGDVGAVWAALAIEERRARMNGSDKDKGNDKPQRVVFTIEDYADVPRTDQAPGPSPQPAED